MFSTCHTFMLFKPRLRMFRLSMAALVLSQCFFINTYAAEHEDVNEVKSTDEETTGMLSGMGSIVDETHGKVSDRFSSFIVQIDDYIGSGVGESQRNGSWARVRLDTVKPAGEKTKLAARVKLRVVLPQSQQRFRLLLSTEDDESTASNSDAAQREKIASEDNNDIALALRFVRTARERFSLKYDLGARYRDDKAQLFAKLNIAYKRDSILSFTNVFSNNVTYFSASGYENRFNVNSSRLFFNRESLYFRNSLDISWRKGNKGAGIGETIGFYADLSKRKALAFEGITGYATSLNEGATDKFRGVELRLRYRHNIWRPWFHYEIWPSVSWSSSNDYEQAYGGLVRFEVTLGQI